MTSKEMLEVIRENNFNEVICTIPPLKAYNGITKEEMFELIDKDLEVLEIIKKSGLLRANLLSEVDWLNFRNKISDDEFNKIKERLEKW